MRVLLKIAYLGTAYHGWQVQPNGITVQEKLQDALEAVYKVRLGVTGCSRTDAGVHAREFYCHFDTEVYIPESGIVAALNSKLPDDITAIDCRYVADDFHARYNSLGKNYIYRILNHVVSSPFDYDRAWHISRELDLDKMNDCLSRLVGTHDFVSFSSSGRTVEDTVRTITECKAYRNGDYVEISVTANGFLYNMVRIIVGTAVEASDGRVNPTVIDNILLSGDRNLAGITAPPQGLYLNKVLY